MRSGRGVLRRLPCAGVRLSPGSRSHTSGTLVIVIPTHSTVKPSIAPSRVRLSGWYVAAKGISGREICGRGRETEAGDEIARSSCSHGAPVRVDGAAVLRMRAAGVANRWRGRRGEESTNQKRDNHVRECRQRVVAGLEKAGGSSERQAHRALCHHKPDSGPADAI